jgi:glycosyltransferase involved in cell wall biosynthesis
MNILINCTNFKAGGGLQVADSICCSLYKYPEHNFVVVLSRGLSKTKERMAKSNNVVIYNYDIKNNLQTLIYGRDEFLDNLCVSNKIDAVLTIFGPSRWNPRCIHLSGFARPHLVIPESPYFSQFSKLKKVQLNIKFKILSYYFKRSTRYFWTENPFISARIEKLIRNSKVYTVTNYYNQIFDQQERWVWKNLQPFEGCTLLTVTSFYPHKNLPIAINIARTLKNKYPDFRFRFVFTIDKEQFPEFEDDLIENFLFIGKVDIAECPSLYQQADIMFQPSLLECFSATYPEAMKMGVPIVTTSLDFAKGLCRDAAKYYSPMSAEEAADAIYDVANKESLRKTLITNGKKQLMKFDTYNERTEKLIRILEDIYRSEENKD